MGDLMDDDVIPLVRKYALQNALEYDGEGKWGPHWGAVIGQQTSDQRPRSDVLGFQRV